MKQNLQVHAECEVTFLPENEGGPSKGFWPKKFNDNFYRPCFVFGDPRQRKAKIIAKDFIVETEDGRKKTIRSTNFVDEPYFGVSFKEGPEQPELGKPFKVVVVPFSQDAEDIKNFEQGATFTIREGAQIVGFGSVLRTYHANIKQQS